MRNRICILFCSFTFLILQHCSSPQKSEPLLAVWPFKAWLRMILTSTKDLPPFAGAEILVRHTSSGSIGWILNGKRTTIHKLGLSGLGLPPDLTVRIGGPVETGKISFLYRDPGTDAVHFSRYLPTLIEILKSEPANVIVFAGYSGWAEGQLASEIRRGLWVRSSKPRRSIFVPET
jgi:putative AlgH/UPF0301 family transcriptional regulator